MSSYYANDRLGNLWTIDGSGKSQTTYEDFSGFGLPIAGSSGSSPFGFGGANGCQTDADTGLVLMGHRYYDPRLGRFLSQDPIGDGDNWYAYAGNDPVDETDPSGLFTPLYNNLGAGGGQDGTGEMTIGNPEGVAALDQAVEDAHGLAGFNGYWTHGVPTGFNSAGLPSLEQGDLVTEWVPGINNSMNGIMLEDHGQYRQQPTFLEKATKLLTIK